MPEVNYTRTEKLVHRLALKPRAVRELSFDLDQSLGEKAPGIEQAQHVFIAGLARAGTSILLRTLYASGQFSTLTYRNMPFVLAPQLWTRISAGHRARAVASERAHGDGLDVDFDSPESFEEVFWLTFCGEHYVKADHLLAHTAGPSTLKKFRAYVASILAAAGTGTRYLSKNNNNVLRLASLTAAFPRSTVIVPFRDPVQQSLSLRNQHRRFMQGQADDSFVRDYMSWLGHFEFGSHHLPLRRPDCPFARFTDTESLDYWCANWYRHYRLVLETVPDNAIMLDYDRLCVEPADVLARLFSALDLDPALAPGAATQFKPPAVREPDETVDADLMHSVEDIYRQLQTRHLS